MEWERGEGEMKKIVFKSWRGERGAVICERKSWDFADAIFFMESA